eukprot:SAG31_NODE_12386_length_945_cov_2.140662_1_plen_165_part_00
MTPRVLLSDDQDRPICNIDNCMHITALFYHKTRPQMWPIGQFGGDLLRSGRDTAYDYCRDPLRDKGCLPSGKTSRHGTQNNVSYSHKQKNGPTHCTRDEYECVSLRRCCHSFNLCMRQPLFMQFSIEICIRAKCCAQDKMLPLLLTLADASTAAVSATSATLFM